jgi:DNA-binding transcriptional MerR regulator
VRLRRILFYCELGFPLDEIAAILADPDVGDHLRRQHRLLRERIARLSAMVAALEKEMEAPQMGISLTPEEQFEIFGTDKAGGEWAQEAEQRWGDTDAHRQASRRTAAYGKEEWLAIKAEMYVADERFAKRYEDVAPGLARYVHDAITANADRAAGAPN